MTKEIIRVRVGTPRAVNVYSNHGEIYIDGTESLDVDYSDLEYISSQINEFKRKYLGAGGYTKLWFQAERACGCYHECSCSPLNILYGEREETQIEYDHRLQKQKRMQEVREQNERAQYERLKSKFEGS